MIDSSSPVLPRVHSLLIVAALVGVVGCAEPGIKQEPVYPVTGWILYGDKPAAGAIVCFHPQKESQGLTSHAEVTADGKFTLSTYIKADGARKGEYIVTIFWPEVHAAPSSEDEDDSSELPPDRLRGRFASPQTSVLRAAVGSEAIELEPLDLKTIESQRTSAFHLRPKA